MYQPLTSNYPPNITPSPLPEVNKGTVGTLQEARSLLEKDPRYQRLMDYIVLETRLESARTISQQGIFKNPFEVAGFQDAGSLREAIDYLRSVQAIKGIGYIQVSTNAQNLASKKALRELDEIRASQETVGNGSSIDDKLI